MVEAGRAWAIRSFFERSMQTLADEGPHATPFRRHARVKLGNDDEGALQKLQQRKSTQQEHEEGDGQEAEIALDEGLDGCAELPEQPG